MSTDTGSVNFRGFVVSTGKLIFHRVMDSAMARDGDFNFEGSGLDRGVPFEPRETEEGYASTFLDKTKIKTPEPTDDSALTLDNTEGSELKTGDYNFEGSALERDVPYEPKETDEGYGSTFLDKTKIKTPEPKNESAVTLENTEGAETRKGDYNFEGSALDRGVPYEPKETKEGYASTFLDKTKIETPESAKESALTLENTEGDETRKGDYNFEGSALDRGVPYEPNETEDGYDSTFLDKTKIKTPEPENDSALTLENTEGAETRKGDYNFEGSALDRGVPFEPEETEEGYTSTFLDKTKIKTPEPEGSKAVTLEDAKEEAGSTISEPRPSERPETTEGGSSFLDEKKVKTPEIKNEGSILDTSEPRTTTQEVSQLPSSTGTESMEAPNPPSKSFMTFRSVELT